MTERGQQIPCRRIHMPVFRPNLLHVRDVLKRGLSESFAKVRVCVVNCPDLTKHPFNFMERGLCQYTEVLEIGDMCGGLIIENKNKTCNFIQMLRDMLYGPCYIIGGSLQHRNSINNKYITNVTYWGPYDHIPCSIGNAWNNTVQNCDRLECNIPSSFFMSAGMRYKVLKVRVEQRKANINFGDAMHNALRKGYRESPVVLGGAFYVNNGAVKHEVTLRKLAPINSIFYPYKSPFHEVEAPQISAGAVYSFKSYGPYRFRGQRFYTVSTDGSEGGLYCNDCSPYTAEYIGYFNVARIFCYANVDNML